MERLRPATEVAAGGHGWPSVPLRGHQNASALWWQPVISWDDVLSEGFCSGGEVHVWRASLEQTAFCRDALRQTLSADEWDRAARFHQARHRDHFIVGRGVLRSILSGYAGIAASDLRFIYNAFGKPMLAEAGGLQFNVAHSGEVALYAFALGRRVGVDVEIIRPEVEVVRLAERFFSPREVEQLGAVPDALKHLAFLNGWTRKEAYLKARGTGLAMPLDQFDVSLRPDEPARLLRTREDEPEARKWSLQELDAGVGYVAALAVEGGEYQIRCWQWSEKEGAG